MHGSRWRALETEQSWQPKMAALGKPRDLSPDLTYNCHRASARPYTRMLRGLDSDSGGRRDESGGHWVFLPCDRGVI
jgi:hypothetical protein